MLAWRERYGRLPTSYDWSRTHARRRGGRALARLVALLRRFDRKLAARGEWGRISIVEVVVRPRRCSLGRWRTRRRLL
jgi:hypothetical protein